MMNSVRSMLELVRFYRLLFDPEFMKKQYYMRFTGCSGTFKKNKRRGL